MTFKKGDPRPAGAGRQKGKPTKKQIARRRSLESFFAAHDFVVEDKIVEFTAKGDVAMVRALTALLPYLQPRLAAEITAPKPDKPADAEPLAETTDLLKIVNAETAK